jgi:RND family efflux transporter MFP subunit
MNRFIKSFALFGVVAVVAGCGKSSPTGAKSDAPRPMFTVVKPEKKSLPKFIDQPGTVHAYEEAALFAKVAGFVKKYHVEMGDPLTGPQYDMDGKITNPNEWTVLAELSIPELEDDARQKEALVAQTEAEREQAVAQAQVAKASFEAAEAVVKQADAGLNRARADLAHWLSEDKRIAKAVADKVVDLQTAGETHNQFLAAEATKDEAAAKVTAMQKGALKSKSEWDKAQSDVKAAGARVNVAKAERDRAKSMSDYRFIRAPFSGVVTWRKADPGKFVFPAGSDKAEPLFVVMRLDKVRVQLDVPEADAGLVTKGIEATVKAQALKTPEFKATVTRTADALDPASRTLKVEIERPNADPKLKAGTYVNVRIIAPMPAAWVLPNGAVVKQADVTVCFRHENGKAVRLPIRTGRSDGNFTEVLQKQVGDNWVDWTGDEAILTGPTANLKDGQEVKVGPKSAD